LDTSRPLLGQLPALLQEDDFTQRFTAGLDDTLASVFCTLDNLHAYVDPSVAPADFVVWLAEWVGVVTDENWTVERRRKVVAAAVQLYQQRGTVAGLRAELALHLDVPVEVVDSAGADWSLTPGAALPETGESKLTVRVRADRLSDEDRRRIDAIVAAAKPAHVAHRIEVINR
jgi:phage tail-like protein